MAYQYYQSRGRGWGTDQYEFVPPPPPTFQPQPSWGGYDYFRAHAISPDPSLYDSAWSRVRNYPTAGVGYNEAKVWHSRAYGGQVDLGQLSPYEIGHAAAYEACRNWRYNTSLYEPIGGDLERQREALIGLAMAEATRLWHYSGRALDRAGREAACEAAAATARVIHDQQNIDDVLGPPPLHRRSSYSSFHSSGSASPYDAYDYDPAYPDDGYVSDPYRPSRRRYSSSSSRPPPIQYSSSSSVGFPTMGPTTAPLPIQASPSYSYQRRPSLSGSYPSGGLVPMPTPSQTYSAVPPVYSTPYGSPAGGFGMPQQQPYTVYGGSSGGYAVPAGSTVIIQNPSRSRKRSHRHRRHSTVKY